MSTPEPEPDAYEPPLVRVKMRGGTEQMRAELAGMKLGELKKRAKALGIEPAALEERMDEADDPKAAVVEMILAAAEPEPEPEPEPQAARVPVRAVGTLKTLALVIGV